MDVRQFFFKNRSYTPIPLALAIIILADPGGPVTRMGLLLLLVGETLRLNGVHYAGGATRTKKVGAPQLCTDGPFAYVRNPLYLGNIILYVGVVLIAGGTFMWQLFGVTVTFFFLQYSFIISLEEQTLADKFGEEYRSYLAAVPRLLPRIVPWPGRYGISPATWKKTFRTERRTLQMIAIYLLFIMVKTVISR